TTLPKQTLDKNRQTSRPTICLSALAPPTWFFFGGSESMKISPIILFLSLVVITTSMAQGVRRKAPHMPHGAKSPRSTPTVEQVIDKYVQAIGGEAAHRKLMTRVIKGTFEIQGTGIIGSFEHEAMAPNKLRVTLQAQTQNGARWDLSSGFDG